MTVHDLYKYLDDEIEDMKNALEIMRGEMKNALEIKRVHTKTPEIFKRFEDAIHQKVMERKLIHRLIERSEIHQEPEEMLLPSNNKNIKEMIAHITKKVEHYKTEEMTFSQANHIVSYIGMKDPETNQESSTPFTTIGFRDDVTECVYCGENIHYNGCGHLIPIYCRKCIIHAREVISK